MDLQKTLLTFDGRIARQEFWIGVVCLIIVNIVAALVIGGIFVGLFGIAVGGFVLLLLSLALAVPGYAVLVKRSNDRGHPQVYVQALTAANVAFSVVNFFQTISSSQPGILMMLVAVVMTVAGLWALIDLGCLRGTKGPNQYGPDPLASA